MKTDLKAKFLQHLLNKKNEDQGFTLIELLVVIIIIGILSAIALPSFLNQAAKARQSEAKTFIGAVVRAQQAYRIENTSFGSDFNAIQVGLPETTENYSYTIPGSSSTTVGVLATPIDAVSLKGFSGGVVVLETGQTATATCQTEEVQAQTQAVVPTLDTDPANGAECGNGMEPMK